MPRFVRTTKMTFFFMNPTHTLARAMYDSGQFSSQSVVVCGLEDTHQGVCYILYSCFVDGKLLPV